MPCKSMSYKIETVKTAPAQSSDWLIGALGAVAAAAALISVVRSRSLQSTEQNIRSTNSLRTELKTKIDATTPSIQTLEAIQSTTVNALANTPFVLESQTTIQPQLTKLLEATSSSEAFRAQYKLIQAIEASHNRVFANAVKVKATNALKTIGFTTVKILSESVHQVRLIATNYDQKQVHAVLKTAENSEPSIAAEVTGATHDESHQVLDALILALGEEGLRSSGPPTRRGSGGVIPHHHHHHNRDHSHSHSDRPESKKGPSARRSQQANKLGQQRQRN